MKLLSVSLARSFWFGQMMDFNPKGIAWFSTLVPFVVDFYKFKKFPVPTAPINDKEGVIFEDGEFLHEDALPIAINSMTIYPGGIVVDTRSSTEVSDAFLDNLFTQVAKEFNVPPYEMIITRRTYYSQVYITTGKSFDTVNPKLQKIADYLTRNVGEDRIPFKFGGLSFWPDQVGKYSPSPFTIERTAGAPFSENRYFSAASLQTDQHLELLNMFEKLIS